MSGKNWDRMQAEENMNQTTTAENLPGMRVDEGGRKYDGNAELAHAAWI